MALTHAVLSEYTAPSVAENAEGNVKKEEDNEGEKEGRVMSTLPSNLRINIVTTHTAAGCYKYACNSSFSSFKANLTLPYPTLSQPPSLIMTDRNKCGNQKSAATTAIAD